MRQRKQETVINYLGTENVVRLVDAVATFINFLQGLEGEWDGGAYGGPQGSLRIISQHISNY